MYFLMWILIGWIAGWLTGRVLKGGVYGPIDIAMGVAGAVAGGFIMRFSHPSGGMVYSTLAAILGAVVLTSLTAYASGRKRYA